MTSNRPDAVIRNIYLLYGIRGAQWAMLIMPTLVVFFTKSGLSLQQIYVLQALFSLVIVLLEIPSGYFADVLGRTKSVVVGSLAIFIGMSYYAVSGNFIEFLIAEILLGIGLSFISGSDSALLYDSLVELKRENEYQKHEGRLGAIMGVSEGFGAIAGGFLAAINLRYPFYAEAILVALGFFLSLKLIEPQRSVIRPKVGHLSEIWGITKQVLHHNKEIKWLILFSSLVGTSTLCMAWSVQPYMEMVQVPLVWFGVIWAAFQFATAFFSLNAFRFESIFGRKVLLFALAVVPALGYLLLSLFQTTWAIGFILLFYLVRGVNGPIFKDYVNRLIDSTSRATILSINSFVFRVFFTAIGPVIGWLADRYSLPQAFQFAAALFSVLGLLSLFCLLKESKPAELSARADF